jgi:hypothetical protein
MLRRHRGKMAAKPQRDATSSGEGQARRSFAGITDPL